MLLMVRKDRFRIALLLIGVFISSCSGGISSTPRSTLSVAPPQNPYQAKTSPTGTAALTQTETAVIPTSEALLPSPTPFKHSIQSGDTLFGIALQYNISLDELVSANPGVDTSLLAVGTELIIPFSDDDELGAPTPTPYPVTLLETVCYPARTAGTWCIVLVENDQNIVLENISVVLHIYSANKELIKSQAAIPPLNYLFLDQILPLAVLIESDLPENFQAQAVLLTSLPSEASSPGVEILKQLFRFNDKKTSASISGSVQPLETDLDDKEIWIAAVAFSDGKPAGIRKWISSEELKTNQQTSFEFSLYSLGPPIDEIKLYAEIH